jgi:hypothetical protein
MVVRSASWEHTFLTTQPRPLARFRRAIERRALWMAEDAARELPELPLEDALQTDRSDLSGERYQVPVPSAREGLV